MSLHKEISFENEIWEHLAGRRWANSPTSTERRHTFLRTALISAAVTGQIDVCGEEESEPSGRLHREPEMVSSRTRP